VLLNFLLNDRSQKTFTAQQLKTIQAFVNSNKSSNSFEEFLLGDILAVSKSQPAESIDYIISFQQEYDLINSFIKLLGKSRYYGNPEDQQLANSLSREFSEQFFSSKKISSAWWNLPGITRDDQAINKMLKPYLLGIAQSSNFRAGIITDIESLLENKAILINPLVMACEVNEGSPKTHIVKNTPSARKNNPNRSLCNKQFKGKQTKVNYLQQSAHIYGNEQIAIKLCNDCQAIEQETILETEKDQRLTKTPVVDFTATQALVEYLDKNLNDGSYLEIDGGRKPSSLQEAADRLREKIVYDYCFKQIKLMSFKNHPENQKNLLPDKRTQHLWRTRNKMKRLINDGNFSIQELSNIFADHPVDSKIYL
jgi:hypothetical protein